MKTPDPPNETPRGLMTSQGFLGWVEKNPIYPEQPGFFHGPTDPNRRCFFFWRSWADLSCFLKVISKIIFSIWLRRKPWMMEKLKNGGGISNQFFGYSIRNDCKWKKIEVKEDIANIYR